MGTVKIKQNTQEVLAGCLKFVTKEQRRKKQRIATQMLVGCN